MRLEHWIQTIPLRLRSLFRRDRLDAELDEELRERNRLVSGDAGIGGTPQAKR